MQVLIADNNSERRSSLEQFLSSQGIVVTAAGSGPEALAAALLQVPDVIAAQTVLPVMDGYELAGACRNHISLLSVPVLLYTENPAPEHDAARLPSGGACRLIPLPADPGELLSTLQSMVKTSRTEAAEMSASLSQPAAIPETEPADFYRRVFERSGAAAMVIDPDYHLSTINDEFIHIAKLQPDQIKLGMRWTDFIHPNDIPAIEACLNTLPKIHRRIAKLHDIRFIAADGDIRAVDMIFTMIPESGQTVASLLDYSQIKRQQEELREAMENAESMSRVKSRFLANMSHELRTPMIGILGYAELLREQFDMPEVKLYASIITKGATRLMESLDMILDLSRLEVERQEVSQSEVEVIGLLGEIVRHYEPAAQRKRLWLTFHSAFARLKTRVNIRMFREVVTNLVSNAIKYTATGGIHISLEVSNAGPEAAMCIRVTDTGIGIQPERLPQIWAEIKPIYDGSAQGFHEGGLGLAITRKFVEKMHGTISVSSTPGNGSVFTVLLPAPIIDDPEPAINVAVPAQIIPAPRPAAPGGAILLVEDDPVTSEYICMLLHGAFKVEKVFTAEHALTRLKTELFSLILMDINLGAGMTGLEAAGEIRKNQATAGIPLVAITAYAMDHDRDRFQKGGFDYFLAKPFSRQQLLDLIRAILKT